MNEEGPSINHEYVVQHSEIEGMISLAEQTSKNLSNLNKRIMALKLKLFSLMLGGILCVYFFIYVVNTFGDVSSSLSKVNVICFALVFFSALLYSSYLGLFYLKLANKEKRVESLILHELLDITFESLKYFSFDISPLERAVIDIRLKRIRFSEDV